MYSDLQDSGWRINLEAPFRNKSSVIFKLANVIEVSNHTSQLLNKSLVFCISIVADWQKLIDTSS